VKFLLTVVIFFLLCCGSSSEIVPDDVADEADEGFSVPKPADPINCENACKRIPKCQDDLGTEADCLALCNADSDSRKYACCIQYADNCADVGKCITKSKFVCDESGTAWIPGEMFDKCACGDPPGSTPIYQECVREGGDTTCATGLCLKPPNKPAAFCAVECHPDTNPCEKPLVCEETPKKNYCKKPFG